MIYLLTVATKISLLTVATKNKRTLTGNIHNASQWLETLLLEVRVSAGVGNPCQLAAFVTLSMFMLVWTATDLTLRAEPPGSPAFDKLPPPRRLSS